MSNFDKIVTLITSIVLTFSNVIIITSDYKHEKATDNTYSTVLFDFWL